MRLGGIEEDGGARPPLSPPPSHRPCRYRRQGAPPPLGQIWWRGGRGPLRRAAAATATAASLGERERDREIGKRERARERDGESERDREIG